ncbi:LysR family transcriptional regulator [Desulfosporosinus meridiei]|uniref:Transcriptional regulator n=1 Tax=Desulfosporosinus meridiei (strain ATCC BAA-275 / DSM 13257 / KCTC 12902 / NCIMB 13706 / S10) TaxID=768704 RepID=J7IW05_DESMD|nr:LysR family transcriptional regulator [Desulfosporosinus meridiei]AFQ44324.1 transcriptional regulator [Desulfosporosinus meridiei DSM 13257]
MDERLLVFQEVAKTNNISLSAKKLHISQPSVTVQIKSLEREYGAEFFNRSNKGVSLTKEGKVFYGYVQSVLDTLTSAKEAIDALTKNQKKIISLGATLTIGEYILPHLITFLHRIHPEVEFKVKIANTESISQDILEKNMHIGLIEGPVGKNKNLNVKSFWEDQLVVVIPNFHPWAARKTIRLDELMNERILTREEGSGTRKVMEIMLKQSGLDPEQLNIAMELGSTQAIKHAVAAGLGITIISALTVSKESDQKVFKTLQIEDNPLYRPLNILTGAHIKKTKEENILINLLTNRDLIRRILTNDDSDLAKPVIKPHLIASK